MRETPSFPLRLMNSIPAIFPRRFLLRSGLLLLASWNVAISQEAAPADPAALPVLKVETMATPIVTSRKFNAALAPNPRGGWTYVAEFMNYRSTNKPKHNVDLGNGRHYVAYDDLTQRPEAEWLVADLQAGAYKIVKWPGFHVGNIDSCRVLAENGRIFFSVDYAHIYYYDPAEDTVKPLGRVKDDLVQLRFFYRLLLGPDGMIYGSSQSTNGRTTLIRLNPDTLEYRLYENVGLEGRHKDLTYGYTLAVDPPWMYVAVGQDNWELFAVNADTGEMKCLKDSQDAKRRISVNQDQDFCMGVIEDPQHVEKFWLMDGQAYPLEANQPPPGALISKKKYARVAWKNTKPMEISNPPELDPEHPVEIDGRGEGVIRWRPAGSTGEFASLKFAVKNTEPVRIESLLPLPDGSLLGNGYSYNGFFRWFPATGKVDYFGKHGPDEAVSFFGEGKAWICGYPNTVLYDYDPSQPWTSKANSPLGADVNPKMIGYFGQTVTEAHHCRYLQAPGNGRIYICGHRERWSTGTGLGYYEIASGTKFGLGQAYKEIEPSGFLALPKAGRLILSCESRNQENASLIVFDFNLKEVDRLTLKPGLKNTGAIFNAETDAHFLGCHENPESKNWTFYRYDLPSKKIVKSVDLPCAIEVFRRPEDGSFWAELSDGRLARLNPETLELRMLGRLERGVGHPIWLGKTLYGSHGGELVRVNGGNLLP